LIEPEKKVFHHWLQKIAPVNPGAPCSILGLDYTTTCVLDKTNLPQSRIAHTQSDALDTDPDRKRGGQLCDLLAAHPRAATNRALCFSHDSQYNQNYKNCLLSGCTAGLSCFIGEVAGERLGFAVSPTESRFFKDQSTCCLARPRAGGGCFL
jgi:hypothetical protein